jgi:crotonobetainyl-CoA:carnitine CoA-transferase CaiB-like acyl-CoA transferase
MNEESSRAAGLAGPLTGVTVVDLSTVVFGPLTSQILADYGANVIKVESPEGDSTRRTGPAIEKGMASLFLGSNRGKRSIVLDLKQPEAREAAIALSDRADVFMHSMRPQKLESLGISPETLCTRNPRLIYAGLHGFSAGGPYGGRPAYDDIIQGMSGLVALAQMQTGNATYLPTIAADKTCAQIAAHAILAALFARERTGRGGFVEIPMFESMVAFNLVEHLYGQHFEPPLGDAGYPRVLTPWRRPYRTADGLICMTPYTDTHWSRFFKEVGRADLEADPRFIGISNRTRHIRELLEIAAGCVARGSTEYWISTCDRLEIPAAPIAELGKLIEDPHLTATGFFRHVDDPSMGRLRFTGVPVNFDGQPAATTAVPPRLGQDTRVVLREAGLDAAAVDALISSGAAVEHNAAPTVTPVPRHRP